MRVIRSSGREFLGDGTPGRAVQLRAAIQPARPRLVDAGYSRSDQAVLGTLVNDLVVVLKHAMSFAEIKKLNKNLQEKNTELQNALHELKAAMRRVEILEGVKTKLSKFVPATVSRLIDKTPTGSIPDRRRQDLSILFLDIEGYTRLCEKLGSSEVAIIIEKHFSVFMDAIRHSVPLQAPGNKYRHQFRKGACGGRQVRQHCRFPLDLHGPGQPDQCRGQDRLHG